MAHNYFDESVTVVIERDALVLLSPSSYALVERTGYRLSEAGLTTTLTRGEVAALLSDIDKRIDRETVR